MEVSALQIDTAGIRTEKRNKSVTKSLLYTLIYGNIIVYVRDCQSRHTLLFSKKFHSFDASFAAWEVILAADIIISRLTGHLSYIQRPQEVDNEHEEK